ncbi:Nn.00g041560.m01.CDS01 [Neocucurbitaria sp. VM-36]
MEKNRDEKETTKEAEQMKVIIADMRAEMDAHRREMREREERMQVLKQEEEERMKRAAEACKAREEEYRRITADVEQRAAERKQIMQLRDEQRAALRRLDAEAAERMAEYQVAPAKCVTAGDIINRLQTMCLNPEIPLPTLPPADAAEWVRHETTNAHRSQSGGARGGLRGGLGRGGRGGARGGLHGGLGRGGRGGVGSRMPRPTPARFERLVEGVLREDAKLREEVATQAAQMARPTTTPAPYPPGSLGAAVAAQSEEERLAAQRD